MKVREVISMLQMQHDLDDEIMVMWSGSAFREMEHGMWKKCVEVFDDFPPVRLWDAYVDGVIADVQDLLEELRREEV